MYSTEDILINKKNPTLVIRVLDSKTRSCVIVDSKNSKYIGRKSIYNKDEFYNKFEPKTQEDNLKLIRYKQKCKTYEKRKKEKVRTYL